MTKRIRLIRRAASASGQSAVEMAICLPLVVVLVLGVSEMGWALLDAHIVTKLTREGSNMISRDASLDDAVSAMRAMASRPVNFDDGTSKVIFSVIKRGATVGSVNYNKNILYQRFTYGSYPGASHISAGGSFGPAPNYVANNSDNDASLQVSGFPATLLVNPGDWSYVTEIYTAHTLITPFNNFGFSLPTTLYSIAYF